VGWQNGRNAFGILCDKKILVRLKGRAYPMIVRTTLLWSRVLANQEDLSSEVNDSRDENDSIDVWLYKTG